MNTRDENRAKYPDIADLIDGLKAALSKQRGGVSSGVKVKRLEPFCQPENSYGQTEES